MVEPGWRRQGKEPDYRFSLANERTYLAWLRTAMALLAGGVLLDQFSTRLHPRLAVVGIAIGLCALATVLSGMAYARWRANEIAMRHERGLPFTLAIPLLAIGCLIVAGIVTLLLFPR